MNKFNKKDNQELNNLRKKAKYLDVINSFALELFSKNTVDEIVWSVAKQAVAKLGYTDCVIYLFDEKGKYLIQKAAHGNKNPKDHNINKPIDIKVGEGIVGSVAINKVGEIVSDTTKDDRYILDTVFGFSEIAVPILTGETVLGVIDSESEFKNAYSQQDLTILTTIASMVANKLKVAYTTEKLKQHQLLLEEQVKEKTIELTDTLKKLKSTNKELKKTNGEKEILLKEIHHRVKNNLHVVNSILEIQSYDIADEKTRYFLREAQRRIISMASIHEKMYGSENLKYISLREYLNSLTYELLSIYDKEKKVVLDMTCDEIEIDMDTLAPLAFLINEIIANSLKHAFKEVVKPVITCKIKRLQSGASFRIGDNGIGYDYELQKQKGTLGLDLIHSFGEELNTNIQYQNREGTMYIFTIDF